MNCTLKMVNFKIIRMLNLKNKLLYHNGKKCLFFVKRWYQHLVAGHNIFNVYFYTVFHNSFGIVLQK